MQQLAQQVPKGVTIVPALLHEAGFPPGHFDVVHANEVIEHVEDPATLVQQILRVLRPGGGLILRTPNHASWSRWLVGGRWRHFGVRDLGHVGFFSPRSIRRLLGDRGFTEIRIATKDFSLRDRFPGAGRLSKNLLRGASLLPELLSRRLGRGERLTVIATAPQRRLDAPTADH